MSEGPGLEGRPRQGSQWRGPEAAPGPQSTGNSVDDTPLMYQYYMQQEPVTETWYDKVFGRLWRRSQRRSARQRMQGQSAYFALVPLSDDRLSPARTRLAVAILLILAVALIAATFVLVPRGVSIGKIEVDVEQMAWSSDSKTYELRLSMTVPIYNPNYLPVTLGGDLRTLFYTSEAGATAFAGERIPPRALPHNVTVHVNAGRLDQNFIWTVLNQCSTFPHTLIFLLEGRLDVTTRLGGTTKLPEIDTYFFVPCQNSDLLLAER